MTTMTGPKVEPPTPSESGYTAEEVRYLEAVRAHKARTGRVFLTHADHLEICKALGYKAD